MTFHATTILAIKDNSSGIIIGDGQVSLGNTVMKATANKIRKLSKENVISGFAGSTADAFTLFERIEKKLEKHPRQLMRSCLELAKDWRSDKYLRKLEAMMIVMDEKNLLILSGSGDVIEPENNIAAIGSGGMYALSAARALRKKCPDMPLREVAVAAMEIAAEICVFTNGNFVIEEL